MNSPKQYHYDDQIDLKELLDYDESDEIPEDYKSDSEYGKPYKTKGRRIPSRKSRKTAEEARIVAAVEARRKRKRLSHGTPGSNEKNPRRHLFGPESQDLSEIASPTPSKVARTETSSHSPGSGRMAHRRSTMQAVRTPSKQRVHAPPSLQDGESPGARSSLVVKLRTPGRSATAEEDPPETPEANMRRERRERRERMKVTDEDVGEERTVGQEFHDTKTLKQARETRSMTRVTTQQRRGSAATGTPRGVKRPSSSTLKTKLHAAARQQRSTEPEAEVHSDASASPQPKQNATKRRRRGALSSPVELPEWSTLKVPTSSADNNPSDVWSDGLVKLETSPRPIPPSPSPPRPLPNPLPSSPTTDKPASRPSTPPQPSSASKFAPYPPMSPRCVSPFTRGARIALENILADHQAEPELILIDLVEELDDTRPIVNDWEHVTVMKGGSWIYQVMRDIWEEVEYEKDDEMRNEDVDLDIEAVVEKIEVWVDREMVRLGGSG